MDALTATTTEAPAPTIETTNPLKLSEAIRLGAMATKQAHGRWAAVCGEGEVAMCAMSTAWYALTGHQEHTAESSHLVRLLDGRNVTVPTTGQVMSLSSAIIELNDTHRWTRGRIADWLEGLGL